MLEEFKEYLEDRGPEYQIEAFVDEFLKKYREPREVVVEVMRELYNFSMAFAHIFDEMQDMKRAINSLGDQITKKQGECVVTRKVH